MFSSLQPQNFAAFSMRGAGNLWVATDSLPKTVKCHQQWREDLVELSTIGAPIPPRVAKAVAYGEQQIAVANSVGHVVAQTDQVLDAGVGQSC